MKLEHRNVAWIMVALLFVAACGSGEGSGGEADAGGQQSTSETAPDESESPDSEDDPEETKEESGGEAAPPDSGTSGTMTVDGVTMEGNVFRCEPFSFGSQEAHEDDMSLVLFANSGINVDLAYFDATDINTGAQYLGARVDLLYSTAGDEGTVQFDGGASNDADGNWYPETDEFVEDPVPLDQVPVTVEGGRMKGGPLTLIQSWPEGGDGVVEVAFDLEIPSDIRDC